MVAPAVKSASVKTDVLPAMSFKVKENANAPSACASPKVVVTIQVPSLCLTSSAAIPPIVPTIPSL